MRRTVAYRNPETGLDDKLTTSSQRRYVVFGLSADNWPPTVMYRTNDLTRAKSYRRRSRLHVIVDTVDGVDVP